MSENWFFKLGGEELGPCSGHQLKQMVDEGSIHWDTEVRQGKCGKWVAARRVRVLLTANIASERTSSCREAEIVSPLESSTPQSAEVVAPTPSLDTAGHQDEYSLATDPDDHQDEYPLATDPDGHRDESPLVTDTPHESSEENDTEGPDQTYNLCPKCSELLLQGATECHFCGHKLASHAGERSQDADSPEDPTANIHPAWNRVRSGLQLCCYAGLLHGLAFGLLALLCLVVVLPIWLQVLSLVAAFVLVVILFASDSVGDQVPLRFAFVPLGYFVMLIIAPPHVAAVFWTLGLLVAVIASWAGTGAFVAGQAISTAAPDPGARACAGGALASSVISVLCSIVLVLRVFVAEEDTTQVIQSLDYDPVQFGLVLLNSIFMPLAILLFAFFCRAVAVFMNDMEAQREVNAFLVSLCVTFIAYVFMVALVFVLNAVRSMGLALAILLALPMIAMAVTSVFVLLYRFLQLISATQNAIDQCQ